MINKKSFAKKDPISLAVGIMVMTAVIIFLAVKFVNNQNQGFSAKSGFAGPNSPPKINGPADPSPEY